MKMNNWFLKTAAFASIVAMTAVSCKEEERLSGEDTLSLTEEAITDAYYEDADDLSSVVVFDTENPSAGGRIATGGRVATQDERTVCATVTWTQNSTETSGQITIDFENGCTVRGNKREGKIILTYSGGPRGTIGFTVVVTFDAYKINGVELKGTRTIERVAASAEANIKHHITLEDGEAIWPNNGGTILRESDFTREWVRDPSDEHIVLEGEASGTTRRGKAYTMNITDALVYRRECALSEGIHMAVQGTKVFSTNSKQITIDYGDSACDRNVTISINGTSREVTVGSN
jgi:hypothetical protein